MTSTDAPKRLGRRRSGAGGGKPRTPAPHDPAPRTPAAHTPVLHFAESPAPRSAAAPLVLIHGLAGSVAWWDPVLPALTGLRVLRFDLLGHGASPKPGAADYGMAEEARLIAARLDALGIRRATVVGHSTGGCVAIALAEARPDLVAGLGVIDTGPSMDAFLGNALPARLLATPGVGNLLWALRTDGMIRGTLASAFTREVAIPGRLVADVRAMTYQGLTKTDRASTAYLVERPLPARLTALGLPTLVLFGGADKRWPPSCVDAYRPVPGCRVEVLPGVGHTPMYEDPATTGLLLHDFAFAAGSD
ncbi:alpha/beta fold hydrolase [Streptomyces sp. P6-2-1]|uniref:alpha/beta fold hydrolase n=1 Tax=Streptomyces sp. P6-2-1 TaxID=3422591 RepID=UPI003D363F73